MPRPGRHRAAVVVAAALGLTVITAGPALADPAGPTHFDSTVTEVIALDGDPVPIEAEVLGGDTYLVVRATPGTVVEVPGYDGEPYIRFDADGRVEVNERSPARWLNDARYGAADVTVPPTADADAPPSWVLAARDHEYAWHDHRIHFMSPALPPQVDTGAGEVQEVLDWTVPLLVDGREVELRGTLAWVPGPPPWTPALLVTAAVGLAVGLTARRTTALAPLIVVGSLATGLAGAAATLGLPPGSDTEPALVVLPVIALALLGVGRGLRGSGHAAATLVGAASGVPLLVWGVLQSGALVRPIVPGWLPTPAVRLVVALALGIGVAALVAVVREALRLTALDGSAPGADRADA